MVEDGEISGGGLIGRVSVGFGVGFGGGYVGGGGMDGMDGLGEFGSVITGSS